MLAVWRMTSSVLRGLDSADEATPEAVLLRELRAGDDDALGRAYDAHHRAVRAFAQRLLLGDHAAAEDVVHDVFVALPSAIRRFDGRAPLRTFLLSIAVNRARHVRRSWARRNNAYQKLHEEPRESAGAPDRETERRGLAELCERMLGQLPIDQRVAVVLLVLEERSAAEAAQIAGVPEATMRTRLYYARKKLRELFEAEDAR